MGLLNEWKMSRAVTLFMAFAMVRHVEGSTCEIPNGPECFKADSQKRLYRCEWKPSEFMKNATYHLFIETVTSQPRHHIHTSKVTGLNYVEIISERLITKRPVNIWVVARMGNESCRSPDNTATLQETVKYDPPRDISMSRASGSLVLKWPSVEGKGEMVEVKYRLDDTEASWNKTNISTNANDKTVSVTLDLEPQAAYQVLVRQRSIQGRNPLWSNWSRVLDVPTEIPNPPTASLVVEDLYNGTRSLKLQWDGAQYPISAGPVSYHLSIHNWPCPKKWKSLLGKMERIVITAPEFSTSVTYSAVNLSITAANKMGNSTPTYFLVPAQHLKTCSEKPTPQEPKQGEKSCVEWYILADGETRPATVNFSDGTLTDIKQKMRDYVRYYYLRHALSERTQPKTTEMCPIYKREGAPSKAPTEFTFFNVTHNSVVLYWKPIPVAEVRGFLKHYEVCITTSINEPRACHNVSASQTEYLLENLTPESVYKVSLAGVTIAGSGPQATVDIRTSAQPINVWIIIGCMVPVLAVSILCSFLVNRLKSRLFPPVPVPVLIDPVLNRKKNQSLNEVKEEVHEFTMEQLMLPDKTVRIPDLRELVTLLDPSESSLDADEEGSLGEAVPLSPDHRGPVQTDVRDLEMTHQNQGERDSEAAMRVYRNGLVFDMTPNSTEDKGTPL